MATNNRVTKCESCSGMVAVPKGNRKMSLEQVVEIHAGSCPTRRKEKVRG